MDSDRFDRLTRFVANGATRRTTLGLATALGLSSQLASDAKKRKKKKKCKKCGPCRKCKKGKCKPKPNGTACGGDRVCRNGTCGLFAPRGVRRDVAISALTGWSECYRDRYNNSPNPLTTIHAACEKSKLLLACSPTNASTLTLLAWADRADVLFDIGTSNTPHNANGVGWYFDESSSWGFAPEGAPISRIECDIKATEFDPSGGFAEERLCWHTFSGDLTDGWRCGAMIDVGSSDDWERIIFEAD